MVTAPSATYTLSLHDALPICAFGTTVEIECGKGLRFGADDGIAPAGREMNAARRAGGSIGCPADGDLRSEEHTSELQSLRHLVCRLLLEKKKHKRTEQEVN